MKELSIYLHIPFCVRKCRYCDFLSFPAKERKIEKYQVLLIKEIETLSPYYRNHKVISVFIGGGTPSLFPEGKIEALLALLHSSFTFAESAEITIEMNPGTVTEEKLLSYKEAGINRLSIGLQSAQDDELRLLGRIHDYRTFLNTYELARKVGYHNINIDLMSALPGQTAHSYLDTLCRVMSLFPEHISAYSLILEKGTWFYEHKGELEFPDEEQDRLLYELTERTLSKGGYHRYEISNYAKEGFECLHNQVYWKRGDYVGFGLGAASLVENVRWHNPEELAVYEQRLNTFSADISPASEYIVPRTVIGEDIQYLSVEEQMEEYMFLGLRLMEGVSKREFARQFGCGMESIYGKIMEKMQNDGLIQSIEPDRISLTPYGIDISNYVMAQFML